MVPLAMIVTRTLPVPSVLAAVLERDGIALPGHGAEHVIACFNPHNLNDAAMSMRIDTVRGVYRCYGCGIRGNSWTYLTRIRGLEPRAAKALLAELGWPEELFRWSLDWHEEQERVKSGAAKYMDEPRTMVGGRDGVPLARAIAQHDYRLADGRLVCVRYRYERIHRRIPKCLTFTPSQRGGWWEALPNSTAVPTEDRHAGGLPLYRLSELLEAIEGNDREIWIVADERRVDAVLALPDTDFSKDGKVPVTCLFGDYRGKPGQCDLAPLRGRRCLLIADTDSRDRNAVLATARALAKLDCGIRLCLPDGEDETVSHIGSAGCAEEDKTARGFQRPRFGENLHGTCAQRDPVFLLCLHPLSRNCPGACISVDFVPSREPDFARARGCQNQELERQFDSHPCTAPDPCTASMASATLAWGNAA